MRSILRFVSFVKPLCARCGKKNRVGMRLLIAKLRPWW